VTAEEVFPADRITVSGREYRVVRRENTADCASGASGATAAELGRSGCRQLVRALAVDSSGRHAITVGVADLPDATAARRVAASVDQRGGGFTAVWEGNGGPSGGRGGAAGGGVRQTGAEGRFVVYAIAARTDGKPVAKDDRAAAQTATDLRAYVLSRLRTR
jgi:hypothetical protein